MNSTMRTLSNEAKSKNVTRNLSNIRNSSKDELARKNKVSFENTNTPSLNIDKDYIDRYTPNTDFDDYPQEIFAEHSNEPDLTLMCKKCNNHIAVEELAIHEKFHYLLNFFGFGELPQNQSILNEKRKEMIKNIGKSAENFDEFENKNMYQWNKQISLINENYELLKSFINNSFEFNRILEPKAKTEAQGESRIVSNEKVLAIGSCAAQNNCKKTMEDANVILDSFGENSNLTYIGTFDGYDGDNSSSKCCSQLHLGLLYALESLDNEKIQFIKEKFEFDEINNLEKFDYSNQDENETKISSDYYQTRKKFSLNNFVDNENNFDGSLTEQEKNLIKMYRYGFKYAFHEMDKLLARGRDETSKIRWSGSTACCCIVEKIDSTGWIHIANCGDVEAIVVINTAKSVKKQNRNHKVLTTLHTLNECFKDRSSLEKRGCPIIETSLGQKKIQALYSISRGLGFHGDRKIKKFITSKPSMRSFKIEDTYAALIIATKGLWSVINYDKVAEIVLQLLPSRKVPIVNERATSPSVKTILHQYYINRNKEKSREKSVLQTVHDNNEVDFFNPSDNYNDKYVSNESINSKFEKNSNKNHPDENSSDPTKVFLKNSANIQFKKDSELEIEAERLFENIDKKSVISSKSTYRGIKIKNSDLKVVQVSDYELKKFQRKLMDDKKMAKKLDVSQLIAETLANCALKAGSVENITVNCVLLPGCNL